MKPYLQASVGCVLRTIHPTHRQVKGAWDAPYACYPKIGANDIFLSATGENLPLVLDNLMQHPTYGVDFEEHINHAMKSILPNTRKIKTYRSNLSLAVQWHFEEMREPFYLSELSDGSVRMLCWATLLHSPILPTLLVIDEPELGLHVAWMQILAEWIKNAAHKTQVIRRYISVLGGIIGK